jgi:hypothetical protein
MGVTLFSVLRSVSQCFVLFGHSLPNVSGRIWTSSSRPHYNAEERDFVLAMMDDSPAQKNHCCFF